MFSDIVFMGCRFGLGFVAYRRNELSQAEAHFLAASICRPEDSAIYTHLASVYDKIGNKNRALEILEMSIKLRPDDPKAHYIKAVILCSQGKVFTRCIDLHVVTRCHCHVRTSQEDCTEGARNIYRLGRHADSNGQAIPCLKSIGLRK
jgi:tetratricopeptide (TPR) repeat protein